MMRISQRLAEVIAWRAVAELVRRHPEFEEVEFFWRIPGAGPPGYYAARFRIDQRWRYLGLLPSGESNVADQERIDMRIDMITEFNDVRSWAEHIEQRFGLVSPSSTPSTTRQAIGFRLVAETLGRRLAERPFATAMPANLSNSSGTLYEHPEYTSAMRAMWGMTAEYGYKTFLWELLPVDEQRLGIPYRDEMEISRAALERSEIVESPEKAWEALAQVKRHMPVAGVMIAPQTGRAQLQNGEIVDLEALYNESGRSITMASTALFA